jgi:predicted RNA-binding protein with PUA-like domain
LKDLEVCKLHYSLTRRVLNEVKVGDQALFYHSSAEPPGVAGIAEVSSGAEPDPTQFDPKDSHFDPKATPANPIWHCVRVKFKQKFAREVTLPELRERKDLQQMVLLRKGSRLSIQPVTEKEFKLVSKLGATKTAGKGQARG